MKKFILALTFILFAQSAWAQGNPTCPTRPFGDNTNACASTAFVQAAVIGACTTLGSFEVGTGASSQCSTVAGSVAHIGNVADPYDILIAGNAAAGTIFQLQDGRTPRVLTSGMNGIGMQSLIDTSASGFTYSGISLDIQAQAGTSGGILGISIIATTTGTWIPGGGPLPGATAVEATGITTKGGFAWGGDFTAQATTTAATELNGIEANVKNDIAGTASGNGIWIVDRSTVASTAGYAIRVGGVTAASFPSGLFRLTNSAGAFPLGAGAALFSSASSGTINVGFDLSAITMSTGRWVITLNNHAVTSYNAAGSVIQSLLNLDASNVLQLYNSLVGVTSTGFIKANQNVSSTPSNNSSSGIMVNLIDAGTGGVDIYAYGVQPNNHLNRANGTGASPTKVVSTNNIGAYFYGGFHGGSAWVQNTAGEQAVAAEDWNDATHLGTHLRFLTTPTATGANAEAGRFNASGGLSVGTTTDAGIGNVLALNNFTVGTATKTLVLKQGANGTVGTFTCSGAGTITISNTNVAITDTIIISMQSAGGTITTPPAFKTLTASTGFTVLCGATDTSVYNYGILKNAAWLFVPANDNLPASLAA